MKTFGKYDILEEIGKGGFATVFRARDRDLARDVALKVLDPLLMRDPVWVKRFKREARAVAQFKHPHIVSIYEIGQAEGVLYIAMELAEGGNLDDRIHQLGHLSWEETVRLVGEMASALDYAHAKGVLHRDLKPANVLLDPETGSLLTDFGFVRILADNSLSVSLSGGVVGTPAYIAPEVWNGQEATAQTDIYALGCILYEMLTGKQRFTGKTQPAIMMAHFRPPPLPTDWPQDVPQGVNEVLERAMAQEPGDRYETAGELAEALAALTLDRLAEPYAALEEAVAAGQWQEALGLVDEIKAVNPDYRDVAGLEQRALAGLAEAAKQEQAAQWQEAAEQALDAGDFDAAELAIAQWLMLLPGDERALAMKERAGEKKVISDQYSVISEGEERVAGGAGSDGASDADGRLRGNEVVEPPSSEISASTGEGARWGLWAAIAGVAALIIIVLFFAYSYSKKTQAISKKEQSIAVTVTATPLPATNTPLQSTDTLVSPTITHVPSQAPSPLKLTGNASRGEKAFGQNGCSACHTDTDTPVAPSLHGIYGASVELADGSSVIVNDEYLYESIIEPHRKLVAGYGSIMPPTYAELNPQTISDIISYIKSLRNTMPSLSDFVFEAPSGCQIAELPTDEENPCGLSNPLLTSDKHMIKCITNELEMAQELEAQELDVQSLLFIAYVDNDKLSDGIGILGLTFSSSSQAKQIASMWNEQSSELVSVYCKDEIVLLLWQDNIPHRCENQLRNLITAQGAIPVE